MRQVGQLQVIRMQCFTRHPPRRFLHRGGNGEDCHLGGKKFPKPPEFGMATRSLVCYPPATTQVAQIQCHEL